MIPDTVLRLCDNDWKMVWVNVALMSARTFPITHSFIFADFLQFCIFVIRAPSSTLSHFMGKVFLGTFLQLSCCFLASDLYLLCKWLSMCPVGVLAVSHPFSMLIFLSMHLCLSQEGNLNGSEMVWRVKTIKRSLVFIGC